MASKTISEYFIGVDSGTQSTKTVVVDGESGIIVGRATKGYGLVTGLPPGHMEQHPSTWVEALEETLRIALNSSGINPSQIKAIGVSGQQHGFVPLDDRGMVIRPAKLWNDTSTTEECRILIESLGSRDAVIRLIGNDIPPGFTASKILWLKRNEPKNYEKLHTVLLPHDYLNYHLTGSLSMEYGDASGTALMDVKSRRWSKEVLESIDSGLKDKLPPLHPSQEPAGNVRKEIASRFGFGEDVLVSAGGGDNMMGAIGTGNTKPGIVTASFGTSGTVYAYSNEPVVDPQGEMAAFCDSTDGWLPLVCTMNVTVATDLIRNLFRYDYQDLERAVVKAPVGSGGLIFLPYLNGERTPNVPEGTGVYYGLNEGTLNEQCIARATMEGATLGLNYGFNRMKNLGIDPIEIRLTGGGARNPSWRRIAADVFDGEVVTLEAEEGAAFGAALQAIWTYRMKLGERVEISDITERFVRVDESSRLKPNRRNVEIYRRLQDIQDKLSRDLREGFKDHLRLRSTL